MRAVFFVQEGLRDQIAAIMPADCVECVGLSDGMAAIRRLDGRRPAGVITGKGAAAKMPALPAALQMLPRLEFDPRNQKKLAADIIGLLLDQMNSVESDAGSARLAASILRNENNALEESLKAVEDFMYSLGNPRYMKSLSWEPVGQIARIEPRSVAEQVLPLSIACIAAVDLWLPQGTNAQGLQAALVDAAGVSHALRPAEGGAGAGWLRLQPDQPIGGVERDCMLRLDWKDSAPLSLGLGHAVPDQRFALRLPKGPACEQVLALRVWKGLPGVRLPAEVQGAALVDEAGFVSPALLPRPELFAVPPQAQDHISAAFWENEDAVMVHPSRQGPVCAIIRDVDLPSMSHISALVNVGHPRAPSLNFAVGVAPHGRVDEDGFWQRRMGPWVHGLPPHGWAQAHCIPQERIEGRADILLAASLATDGPNDMSWGLFRGFRIASRGGNSALLQ